MAGSSFLRFAIVSAILVSSAASYQITPQDDALLDEIERAAFRFFWEQADPISGQVKDRALASGAEDPRDVASIAATGFGLAALAIAYERNYHDRVEIFQRIENTLKFIVDGNLDGHEGFYYHFVNMTTGERMWQSELSSIDTALLLGGVLTVRSYFAGVPTFVNMATQIYDRVNFEWMLNGGDTLSMGWHPESGFLEDSWNRYCELMILLLQAVGSKTHPIPAALWNRFTRHPITFQDYTYIDGNGPLFTHQFSHAFIDFKGTRDAYANYFENSVIATQAHKAFCIDELGKNYSSYNENFWGITASDTPYGYDAWGGPPLSGRPEGAIVPCATAGSIPFLPEETIAVLHNLRDNYPQTWGPYGFIDAFNPIMNPPWYNPDVIGIDVGVTILMAENYRTGFVWKYYMQDEQLQHAMTSVGFVPEEEHTTEDPPDETEALLDEIERAAFRFFWEQADPISGQVKDRALASGAADPRDVASIAATGFGLAALAIAYERNYYDRTQIFQRIENTLKFIVDGRLDGHEGFYYHFINMTTGERVWESELSSIDTALLLGGVLTVRNYFSGVPAIVNLATQIYDRVNFEWMLNGGDTLSMGWHPETGFIEDSWNRYCELMILLLQAVGSNTHPIPARLWDAFTRHTYTFQDFTYIDGNGPLFTHQFSHAFIDFSGLKDAYANYHENSVIATKAHKAFCIDELGKNYSSYNENFWGITASDTPYGYDAWGGPPLRGKPEGAIVPCAAAGSIPFLPEETIAVLRNLRDNYPETWGPYGFIDAFNPIMNPPWYNPDVIGIDVGVTILMAENYRTGFVWKYYMQDPQLQRAMAAVGFVPDKDDEVSGALTTFAFSSFFASQILVFISVFYYVMH